MNSARSQLDEMSYEAWSQLASDLKGASRSMGRVGLSYARRHPALLLGGGALLGALAVNAFRGKKPQPITIATDQGPIAVAAAPKKKSAKKPTASKHMLSSILMNAARIWLVDFLAAEFRVEADKAEDSEKGGDGARDEDEDEVDGEHAKGPGLGHLVEHLVGSS